MKTADFSYELPDELIARFPLDERTASRLLVCNPDCNEITDAHFSQVLDHISAGDVVVFNNTKVIPARIYGTKASGGKIEVLIERIADANIVHAHIRSSKSPKPGSLLNLGDQSVEVQCRAGALFILAFDPTLNLDDWLQLHGHMPLPPYIDREDTEFDKQRYQTVFAKHAGAVAAPTAGLHFDEKTIEQIKAKGASVEYVTLHVGAGTFQPVRVDDVTSHEMHKEWLEVSEETATTINKCKSEGGRVIAVGTTAVRSLETAAQSGRLKAYKGDTQLFIYPGFEFNVIDIMITNFHLPESTLLMLVSAFSGKDLIDQAYRHAVQNKYRFFSYGDAMLLYRSSK